MKDWTGTGAIVAFRASADINRKLISRRTRHTDDLSSVWTSEAAMMEETKHTGLLNNRDMNGEDRKNKVFIHFDAHGEKKNKKFFYSMI